MNTSSQSKQLPLAPLMVLGGAGFLSIVTEILPAGLLSAIATELEVSESRAGLLTALYAGVIVVTVLPLMTLTAHMSRRRVLILALASLAASNAALAVSDSFAWALVARLLGGAAHGMLWALLIPYASRIVHPDRAGAGVAVVMGISNLAVVIGVPLGTFLGNAFGWRMAIAGAAIASLTLIPLVLSVLPTSPNADPVRSPILKAARLPGIGAVALASPLLFIAHFSVITYIDPLFGRVGATEAQFGLALSLLGVAAVFGTWMAGRFADTHSKSALPLALAALVITFLGSAVLARNPTTAVLAMIPWGATFSAAIVFVNAAAMSLGRRQKDAVSTLLVMTIQAGIAGGAVYGGLTLDVFGVGWIPVAATVPAAFALAIVMTRLTRALK